MLPDELLWAEYPQYESTDVFEHLNPELIGKMPKEDELDSVLSPPNQLGWLKHPTCEHVHDFGGWIPGSDVVE